MTKLPIIYTSGGGFLFWKGLTLIHNLKIDKYNYYFLGVSAGNLINALFICDVNPDDVLKFGSSIHSKYSNIFNIYNGVYELLDNVLPNNAHIICSGRLFIATYSFPNNTNIVGNFDSREILIQNLVKSVTFPISINNLMCGRWDHMKDSIYILHQNNNYEINNIFLYNNFFSCDGFSYPTLENSKKLFNEGKQIKLEIKQNNIYAKPNINLFPQYSKYTDSYWVI